MKSRPLSPHESAAPISSPSPQPRQVGAVICLINSANCGASGPPVSGNVLLPVTGPLHTIRRSSYKVGAGSPRPREPRPQPQSPSPDTPEVGADISPIDYGVQWARGSCGVQNVIGSPVLRLWLIRHGPVSAAGV